MNVKLLFLVVIIISFVIAFYIKTFLERRRLEELYSKFTSYMKETVEQRLSLIDCKPKKFYFEDSAVCFVCDVGDACFGYRWVVESDGEKMNAYGLPYIKLIKFDTKAADFYTDGLASFFSCSPSNETSLKCVHNTYFVLENERNVRIFLENPESFDKVCELVCNKFDKSIDEIVGNYCRCDSMVVGLGEDGLIEYASF